MGRPPCPPLGAVVLHDLKFAGEPATAKLARIRAEIGNLRADALVVSDPQAVAWAFNIRGADVAHTPLPLAFAIVPQDGRPSLYVDGRKLSNEVRAAGEETSPRCARPGALTGDIVALAEGQRTLRLDPRDRRRSGALAVTDNGGKAVRGLDPIAAMKAVKNATEIAGARAAHLRDGAAVTRFLAWFDREAPAGKLTEIDAVEALESFRRDTGVLKDISFPTIAGAGPNGAIVHYRVTRKTNRPIAPGELFLVDSGAQYEDGTTDITRTIAVADATRCASASRASSRATSPSRARCSPTARPARSSTASRASRCGRPGFRLRSRHRPRRRQLSVGARGPGAHLQARHRRSSAA